MKTIKIKENKNYPLPLPLKLLKLSKFKSVQIKKTIVDNSTYYMTQKMICTGNSRIYYFK